MLLGVIYILMDKKTKGSAWHVIFAQHFPWRMLLIDMGIPMVSYSVLANCGKPLTGIFFAGLWSIIRGALESAKNKKISIFTLITMIFALVEFVTFYVSNSLYWISLGIRSELYGFFVILTLLLKKTFIEIMVEESKTTQFTEEFKNTRQYRNCWRFVTIIWGIAYILKGFYYIYIAPEIAIGMAFIIRAVIGWPLDILLIAFSIWFPHTYWCRESDRGNITVPIKRNS